MAPSTSNPPIPINNKMMSAQVGTDFLVCRPHIESTVIKEKTIKPNMSKNSGRMKSNITAFHVVVNLSWFCFS